MIHCIIASGDCESAPCRSPRILAKERSFTSGDPGTTGVNPKPFALSLSKGRSFFQGRKEGRCFDKLSTNGLAVTSISRCAALPERPVSRCPRSEEQQSELQSLM